MLTLLRPAVQQQEDRDIFDRTFNWFNGVIGLHALYVFATNQFFRHQLVLPRMPFILAYGPILFLSSVGMVNKRIAGKEIMLHGALFVFFFIWFIITLFHAPLVGIYSDALCFTASASAAIYSYQTISTISRPSFAPFKDHKILLLVCVILLLFMSMIAFSLFCARDQIYSNQYSSGIFRGMIYASMFGFALVIFKFELHRTLGKRRISRVSRPPAEPSHAGHMKDIKYRKSTLDTVKLDDYAINLGKQMRNKKLYLRCRLSLKELALETHIPAHHLTQVLNVKMNVTFYEYVNRFRIEYACELLKEPGSNLTVEKISELSGFSSKVSFNRCFKSITGSTPSEYRMLNT